MKKFIDIQFKKNETAFIEMQELFNDIGREALFMNHYELSERTGVSPIDWKTFLMDPRVAAFIDEEFNLLKKSKFI